jgi:nucleoside phosphorylase
LVCALAVERRAARRSRLPVAQVGLGARGGLPDGPLVSFGFAGALVPDLPRGLLVTATRVVDADGRTLWEGPPAPLREALSVTLVSADAVVDDPEERAWLAQRSGAHVVDLETERLARSGRLVAVVRAISDTPAHPAGRLARASTDTGETVWSALVAALLREPWTAVRAALGGRRALIALRAAAYELGGP